MNGIVYTDCGADISHDGTYRYLLWREWKASNLFRFGRNGLTLFIMLNPSTADGKADDPTIRRCVAYAERWGHNRLEVVNLFAYRATDPKELLKTGNPVGLWNDKYTLDAVSRADTIVCAWGTMGWIDNRAKDVRSILSEHTMHSLGLTRGGHPKHPLYVTKDKKLEPFS